MLFRSGHSCKMVLGTNHFERTSCPLGLYYIPRRRQSARLIASLAVKSNPCNCLYDLIGLEISRCCDIFGHLKDTFQFSSYRRYCGIKLLLLRVLNCLKNMSVDFFSLILKEFVQHRPFEIFKGTLKSSYGFFHAQSQDYFICWLQVGQMLHPQRRKREQS